MGDRAVQANNPTEYQKKYGHNATRYATVEQEFLEAQVYLKGLNRVFKKDLTLVYSLLNGYMKFKGK